MTDRARVSQSIDAFDMEPLDLEQQRRAALTVCAAMSRAGNTRQQIRDVLAALDLLAVVDRAN